MLNKIFTICFLLTLNACLVRSQPTGKEQVAGAAKKIADELAALFSKFGAKSADDMAAKLLSKQRTLTEADYDDLAEVFSSASRADIVVALQKPIKKNLAKLDTLLLEYKQGFRLPRQTQKLLVAEISKVKKEIGAAADSYRNIQQGLAKAAVRKNNNFIFLDNMLYPASQVLALHKIGGNIPMKGFYLKGTPKEVIEANLLTGNFDNLRKFLTKSSGIDKSSVHNFKKLLAKGNLEREVYPFYNSFVKFPHGGEEYTVLVAQAVADLQALPANALVKRLKYTNHMLVELKKGLSHRTRLLDLTGISMARRADIVTHSKSYLKGAGADGSKLIKEDGISGWAERIRGALDKQFAELSEQSAASLTKEVKQYRQSIDMILRSIWRTVE